MTSDHLTPLPPDPELVEVRLLEVPLELRERSTRHGADLLREMTLIAGGRESGTTSRAVPRRLLEIARELELVYGPYVTTTTETLEAAADRGDVVVPEVVYRLPRSIGEFMQHIADVLAEVEVYCAAGKDLLLLAAPADVTAYRDWSVTEVQRQIAGEPPTPWPTFLVRRTG